VHWELLGFGRQGYGASLGAGFLLTIGLALAGYAVSLFLGVLLGFLAVTGGLARRLVWRPYASIVTGVPSLLVIFFIYYNLPLLLKAVTGATIEISALTSGVVALGMVYASYVGEVVRGAILSLPRGQIDAARALGLSTLPMWRFVLLPQMWRLAFPGLTNTWLALLKDTALVSLVGLNDLVRAANVASGNTGDSFLFFGVTGLAYIACAVASAALARYLEARINTGLSPRSGERRAAGR
jgi:His/Glu/Gln/Arg/opine family amino acid ABC transporter permease subunit